MNRRAFVWSAIGLLSGARLARGHHSTAMYDTQHPVTIKGVVKRFEWINPHALIYMDAAVEGGAPGEWQVELMSLSHLKSTGWTHRTVKVGDQISCTGSPARSGARAMIASRIVLSDGRELRS